MLFGGQTRPPTGSQDLTLSSEEGGNGAIVEIVEEEAGAVFDNVPLELMPLVKLHVGTDKGTATDTPAIALDAPVKCRGHKVK